MSHDIRVAFVETVDALMAEVGLEPVRRDDGLFQDHVIRPYCDPLVRKKQVEATGNYGVVHVTATSKELANADTKALAAARARSAIRTYEANT